MQSISISTLITIPVQQHAQIRRLSGKPCSPFRHPDALAPLTLVVVARLVGRLPPLLVVITLPLVALLEWERPAQLSGRRVHTVMTPALVDAPLPLIVLLSPKLHPWWTLLTAACSSTKLRQWAPCFLLHSATCASPAQALCFSPTSVAQQRHVETEGCKRAAHNVAEEAVAHVEPLPGAAAGDVHALVPVVPLRICPLVALLPLAGLLPLAAAKAWRQ
jgi:hypothetical protein